ncbi:MAG: dihydrolipoamide acetyltransferase family protein [Fimbriimonadaceae bacterium]
MSESTPNVVPILLPQAGNSMEEGTILAWRKRVGDVVKPGDVLYELETDKATIEVEAEAAGKIAKIVVDEGATAPVKTPVAYLAESEADVDRFLAASGGSPTPPPDRVATGSSVVGAPVPAGDVRPAAGGDTLAPTRTRISPAARKAAESLGVDAAQAAPGSGPDGRVTRADVEALAFRRIQPAAPAASASPTAVAGEGGQRRPMPKMRRAIARNLQTSKQTVPHFYVKVTVDAGPLMAYYRREKAVYPCSVNDVIVSACARVLQEFPAFRSQIDGDDIVEFPHSNIGLAVALDDGLVVPVLVGAERLSLQGIAQETRRIVEAARQGKLEGVGTGVFTISNLGMFGTEEFSAIINPPESAILAVGAVREHVFAKDGSIRAGLALTMTLSCDHRVVDGATAARFAARLKEVLEALG